MTPDIALAASAREWPDRLHRYLLDHGGGRVVARVMAPDQAVEVEFDALLIDDICSFLSSRLVTNVKQVGREVIGVFSPADGSDAKRRLLECGISDVLETEASPEEFLEKVRETLAHRVDYSQNPPHQDKAGWIIGLTGVTEGVGLTEVAVGLAMSLGRSASVALVDADPEWPSVAQRLDLPLHPNIRTLLDVVLHGSGDMAAAVHRQKGVTIVGGVADGGAASPLNHAEVQMVLDALTGSSQVVVVDLGSVERVAPRLLTRFDALGLIGTGDPVGVARLIKTTQRLAGVFDPDRMLLVVNRVPRGGYYQSEILREIAEALDSLPAVLLPVDDRITESMWEGEPVPKGAFMRSLRRVARLILEEVGV